MRLLEVFPHLVQLTMVPTHTKLTTAKGTNSISQMHIPRRPWPR
jgi:hypothetical protein